MAMLLSALFAATVLIAYLIIEKRINQQLCPECGSTMSLDAIEEQCPNCDATIIPRVGRDVDESY